MAQGELRDLPAGADLHHRAGGQLGVGAFRRLQGGVAPNVIAGAAEVEWETRPVRPEDHALVKETMARLPRFRVRAMPFEC